MDDGQIILWGLSQVLIADGVLYPAIIGKVCADLHDGLDGSPVVLDGCTDTEAIRRTLADPGMGSNQLTGLVSAAQQNLHGAVTARRGEFAAAGRTPGSAEVVAQIKQRQSAPLTLLTGRDQANAAVLAGAAGLDRYLELGIGGYGDDVQDRQDLLAVACARIAGQYGQNLLTSMLLVTDQPMDVAAAAAQGIRAVGVSADPDLATKLAAAGAADTLPGLSDVVSAVRVILG